MKHIKIILKASFFILFSFSVNAARYCNLLWANKALPSATLNASFDGNNIGVFPVDLQAGGVSTVIKEYKENMTGFVTIDGIYRYWIQYPEEWLTTSQGLKYRIRSELDAAGVQVAGVKTVVTPAIPYTWTNTFECRSVGETYDFTPAIINGIKVEIDRSNAWPGVYRLNLPIKVAYEENKGKYSGQNGNGWQEYATAIKSFSPIDSDNVSITITSKCDIGDKFLNVNMGDSITPDMAKKGVEKKVNVSVTCNSLAKASLSLKGIDIVDGVNNKTKCGTGNCILNFDNGSDNKIIDVNQGVYTVPITVRFQDQNAAPGNFEGSAVLSINIL